MVATCAGCLMSHRSFLILFDVKRRVYDRELLYKGI